MRGKFAFVTGASSGIGAAFARKAAAEGCDVGLTARRGDRLRALASELEDEFGITASVYEKDLSEYGAAESLISDLHNDGRAIDILINNAGFSIAQGFLGVDMARHRAFLELTVNAPVALAHGSLEHMISKGWGRIINISSITAYSSGGKGHTLYPGGKSFLLKMAQSLSAEVQEHGVNVTAVMPGFVATEFQEANGMAEKMDAGPTQNLQQTPEEIVEETWRRNNAGVELVVPGLAPKAMACMMQALPEPIVRAMTRRAAAKYYIGDE